MLDDSARRDLAGTRFTDVRWYAEVGSTNSVVAGLVRAGAPEGVVVVADHQTAGRGRLGRTWEDAPGSSLLLSALLRPTLPAHRLPLLTLAVALAASDACGEAAGVVPLLKWPNDLVAGGGKVGGVLGETVATEGAVAAVVGIGVNVRAGHPLPPGGVALEEVAGRPVDGSALLVALLRRLEARYRQVDGSGFVADYRGRSATLGRPVRVELAASSLEGEAVDVTPEGHLVVDVGGTLQVVLSGDVVHLRAATAR